MDWSLELMSESPPSPSSVGLDSWWLGSVLWWDRDREPSTLCSGTEGGLALLARLTGDCHGDFLPAH